MAGGTINIIEITSWNNDAESLIINYFSYFGLTKHIPTGFKCFCPIVKILQLLKVVAPTILLSKFCLFTVFWVRLWLNLNLSNCWVFWFSSYGCDFWYQNLHWQDIQGSLVKFYFLCQATRNIWLPWEVGLN